MIDGREPNYICLDTRALTLARLLQDSDRLAFFDGVCEAYTAKLSGEEFSAFPDNMVGDLIKQAVNTMIDGFDTYMKRVTANSEWRLSLTGHRQVIDPQSNQDQSNKDQSNKDQINQIKQQFRAEGYTEAEIEDALKRCTGKSVRNIAGYLRQTMDNQRQQQKHIIAHNYTQRDYSETQAELMEEQDREMMEYLKKMKETEGNK